MSSSEQIGHMKHRHQRTKLLYIYVVVLVKNSKKNDVRENKVFLALILSGKAEKALIVRTSGESRPPTDLASQSNCWSVLVHAYRGFTIIVSVNCENVYPGLSCIWSDLLGQT